MVSRRRPEKRIRSSARAKHKPEWGWGWGATCYLAGPSSATHGRPGGAQARPARRRPQTGRSAPQTNQAPQSEAAPPRLGSREAGERVPEPGGPEGAVTAASSLPADGRARRSAQARTAALPRPAEAATLSAPGGARSGYLRRGRRPGHHPAEERKVRPPPRLLGSLEDLFRTG